MICVWLCSLCCACRRPTISKYKGNNGLSDELFSSCMYKNLELKGCKILFALLENGLWFQNYYSIQEAPGHLQQHCIKLRSHICMECDVMIPYMSIKQNPIHGVIFPLTFDWLNWVRSYCWLTGKLWYLWHNFVGDTIVYRQDSDIILLWTVRDFYKQT